MPQKPTPVPTDKFTARTEEELQNLQMVRESTFIRRCSQCCVQITAGNKSLYWETMNFCNEQCLSFYQNMIGSSCTSCTQVVPVTAMGKYCVRFGFEVRHFCRFACLDQFKKSLKCCAYCQNDLGLEEHSVIASVGEKRVIKNFCNDLIWLQNDGRYFLGKVQEVAQLERFLIKYGDDIEDWAKKTWGRFL